MSLNRINPDDIETFSVETNPTRTYVSSSTTGVEGKVFIFPRRSDMEKEILPLSVYSGSYQDKPIVEFLERAKRNALVSGNNYSDMRDYLGVVNQQPQSARKLQTVDIIRFKPTFNLTSDTLRKSVVINTLMKYYRTDYPSAHFGYTNYNTLNFFTASNVPSSSVLLYPNPTLSASSVLTSSYLPDGAFSFDFWINPRYTTDTNDQVSTTNFKAGTLLHLSSCYAVSLITGSRKDVNGFSNGYRLLLQLSNSTDVSPSLISTSSLPTLAFLSEDNALTRNNWHHVTIRWGTNKYNEGTGSFVVNGVAKGLFVIPSASVKPASFFPTKGNPNVLAVGNYYEGTNTGNGLQAYFFTSDTAYRDGVESLITGTEQTPDAFLFNHPLNAEIHDLKVYKKYLNDIEIKALSQSGPKTTDRDLLFYLPPFYTQESPTRSYLNGTGGVLETPFFSKDGTTTHPWSIEMAYSVGGHYINLENYTRELVNGRYPRLWGLTASLSQAPSTVPQTADAILYATGSNAKRAVTILPNDNGAFYPNFSEWLAPLSSSQFVNDLGVKDYSQISLRNIYTNYDEIVFKGLSTGSLLNKIMNTDPEISSSLVNRPGSAPTILQRTRDNTGNQIVFFDISNLYYGKQIKPGSLTMADYALSGTNSKVSLVLKDDGLGNVYRASATGSHATWSSVGTVFYQEGIVILKSPHLYYFGEQGFTVDFKGVQNLHVLNFNLIAKPLQITSSSNPSYLPVSASDNSNDNDQKFVYITTVNLHDDNLNVIGKTVLSQPFMKRTGDKLKIRTKIDF